MFSFYTNLFNLIFSTSNTKSSYGNNCKKCKNFGLDSCYQFVTNLWHILEYGDEDYIH